jgi:hypothetical protein
LINKIVHVDQGGDSRLILVSSTCGGKEGIPKPAEFLKLQDELINKSLNHIPISHEELKTLIVPSYGQNWMRMHLNQFKFQKI